MAKFSKNLLNKLTEFLVEQIGSKVIDGITYSMELSNSKNGLYDRAMDIKRDIINEGFNKDEIFRVYAVSNGYIFDMDLSVAKHIAIMIQKAVAKANNDDIANIDMFKDKPNKRRKNDMIKLAKYIQSKYEEGEQTVEVALFSRNSTPRIIISANDGKQIVPIKYNAYAIRHWDIETINQNILVPSGLRVTRISPCEILPSLTGVKFLIHTEAI